MTTQPAETTPAPTEDSHFEIFNTLIDDSAEPKTPYNSKEEAIAALTSNPLNLSTKPEDFNYWENAYEIREISDEPDAPAKKPAAKTEAPTETPETTAPEGK